MSNILLPASLNSSRLDTYTRVDGVDTVHVQAMVTANPLTPTVGTVAGATQAVTMTSLGDMDGVMVLTAGTFSGTIAFEASVDGTNWYSMFLCRASSLTGESSRALTGTTLESWRGNLAGFSQFRVRCTAYTSGSASITIAAVSMSFEPTAVAGQILAATQSGTWTVQPGNTANTTPWLVVSRGNMFFNESTTAQAAAATLTGTARDVGLAASTAQPYAAFNAMAFADQAGTMRIEASNDNTTWRRATADTAVAANAAVILSIPVMTRYHRVVYINGATIQTAFMLNSSYTAA